MVCCDVNYLLFTDNAINYLLMLCVEVGVWREMGELVKIRGAHAGLWWMRRRCIQCVGICHEDLCCIYSRAIDAVFMLDFKGAPGIIVARCTCGYSCALYLRL